MVGFQNKICYNKGEELAPIEELKAELIERKKLEAEALVLISRLSGAQIKALRELVLDLHHTPDGVPCPKVVFDAKL